MLIMTIAESKHRAWRARLESAYDSPSARCWLAFVFLMQGAIRSGARLKFGWRRLSLAAGLAEALKTLGLKVMSGWWKLGIERSFWSEEGIGRDQLLEAVLDSFPGACDDETGKTDIIVKDSLFWNWAVVTVTEFHGDEKQLTRLRLLARPKLFTRVVTLLLILLVPMAIVAGISGEVNTLVTLIGVYLLGEISARIYMRLNRPRFNDLAMSLGLKPA
jgi:hypothetical protein